MDSQKAHTTNHKPQTSNHKSQTIRALTAGERKERRKEIWSSVFLTKFLRFHFRSLVVTGLYRYVRNPMYVGVLPFLLGEALFFGSTSFLLYALGWLAF